MTVTGPARTRGPVRPAPYDGAMAAKPSHPRVLGIDPGTRVVGWGIVERDGPRLTAVAHGTLRADGRESIDIRLARIAAQLREVIAEHAPTQASIEEAFYGRDAKAAQRLGEGRGAIVLVLAEAGLPVAHYANNVVKKALTGHGRATKDQVAAMLRRVLGLDEAPASRDASDALALAVCHHQRPETPGAGGVPPRLAAAIQAARARDAGRKSRR